MNWSYGNGNKLHWGWTMNSRLLNWFRVEWRRDKAARQLRRRHASPEIRLMLIATAEKNRERLRVQGALQAPGLPPGSLPQADS